jgi:putative flippase GtrA
MKLSILYVIFAVIATLTNLLAQEITVQMYSGIFQFSISVMAGTVVGLIVKYLLDKKYIFNYHTQNQSQDAQTFVIYAAMGIITTLIFWSMEYAFDTWFETRFMRYTGAVLGLMIGYATKYQLDKRFVFVER